VTDTEEKARLISSVAMELGVVVDVLIDVDPGIHRTGVAPRKPALALAQVVDGLPGLYLRGIQCYDGLSQHVLGFEARRKQVLARMVPIVETVDLLRQAGLNIEFVTGGGTGTYNIDHEHFTDVQCGSYVFMDAQYLAIGKADGSPVNDDFLPSLSVVTTVISTLVPEVATADAGTKSLTCDEPDPLVIGAPHVRYRARADEFGAIRYEGAGRRYRTGDRIALIVPHVDPVVNLFDWLYVTRHDRVEAVWPITARGKSQ
jgi:D-serine deaminase-like pyridoxal phosphate-dependent protein